MVYEEVNGIAIIPSANEAAEQFKSEYRKIIITEFSKAFKCGLYKISVKLIPVWLKKEIEEAGYIVKTAENNGRLINTIEIPYKNIDSEG